ncbi:hypothetical protein ACLK1X_21400 [Escherichia coli]
MWVNPDCGLKRAAGQKPARHWRTWCRRRRTCVGERI